MTDDDLDHEWLTILRLDRGRRLTPGRVVLPWNVSLSRSFPRARRRVR